MKFAIFLILSCIGVINSFKLVRVAQSKKIIVNNNIHPAVDHIYIRNFELEAATVPDYDKNNPSIQSSILAAYILFTLAFGGLGISQYSIQQSVGDLKVSINEQKISIAKVESKLDLVYMLPVGFATLVTLTVGSLNAVKVYSELSEKYRNEDEDRERRERESKEKKK